jgi:hypothetical protein
MAKLGGKRPGAGRKPGSANRKTREIADAAAEAGITPLEWMLSVIRDKNADAKRAGTKWRRQPLHTCIRGSRRLSTMVRKMNLNLVGMTFGLLMSMAGLTPTDPRNLPKP